MKKIYFLGFTLLGLAGNYNGQIAWDGGGATTSFTEAANWVGDIVPSSSDDVVFDGTSAKNCIMDDPAGVFISNLSIGAGYSGTVDGQGNPIGLSGNFSQAGGTFISTSVDLEISGDFSLTGGTFTHGGGNVSFFVAAGVTTHITGSVVFNSLTIEATNNAAGVERIVNFGTSTTSTLTLSPNTPTNRLFSYQGNVTITSVLTILGTNTGIPTSNSGIFTFSGAGPITITGSLATARNKMPNLVFNTSGNISMTSTLNVQGNWTGTQGTLISGSSITNLYGSGVTINGTAAAFDNLVIQTGASVTFPASAEVLVGRNFTNSGSVTLPSTNVLGLNGNNTAQTINGTGFTAGSIRAHTAGTGRTITLNTALSIVDSLKLEDRVTFAAGNNLTLRSNASGTARLAELIGTASITGNVTVQTFIPGQSTGWTNMGVRGVSGETFKSWDTYSTSAGANGIPMTCANCDFDEESLGAHFVSIQGWDEPSSGYTELTGNDFITPGVGFWVYVGNGFSNTTDLTVINNGPLVTGPVNFVLSGQNTTSNLMANPYASPISWARVLNVGINSPILGDQSIYVFNPDLGVTTSWTGFASNPGGPGSITDVIPGGQAFYVDQAIDGQTFTFDETVKITSTAPLLKPATVNYELFRLKIEGGNNEWDVTTFFIHPDATPLYGKMDARKFFQSPGYLGFPGAYSKYTSISSKDAQGKDYSINAIPLLTQDVSIPVLAKVSTTGTYTISAKEFQDIDGCIMLKDNLMNTTKDLKAGPYIFSISDTTSAPRFELLLCRDQSVNPDGLSENNKSQTIFINQDESGPYVVTKFEQSTKATISAYNIIGQKLMEDITVTGTMNTTRLNLDVHNQVVLIKVQTPSESLAKKVVAN